MTDPEPTTDPAAGAGGRVAGWKVRGEKAADTVGKHLPPMVLRMFTTTLREFRDLEVFDRAMTLAAQAFTSIFPLIIAIAAIRPGDSDSLGDDLADILSAPDASRDVLEKAFPTEPQTLGSFGILGLLIVIISATSFSRALTRMYARLWQVAPPKRLRGVWRWIAALLAVAAALIVLGALRALWENLPYDNALDVLTSLVISSVLWVWTPWVLLGGAVYWRRLVPGGVLMGVATGFISVGSSIYLPRALSSAARQYGALGIAFTYISWLFVIMAALVGTTLIGAVVARVGNATTDPDITIAHDDP